MGLLGAARVRRRPGDDGVHADERRAGALRAGRGHGRVEGDRVDVAVLADAHLDDVPAVGAVARGDVLGERQVGVTVDRDAIVVVDEDEVAQAQRAGE